MSCICGIVKNNEIWIGADSAGSDMYSIAISESKKVFKKEVKYGFDLESILGEMIIGVAGSWRQLQLLQHVLQLPLHYVDKSDEAYLVTDVISSIKECIKDEKEQMALLIGYRGKLYRMNNDFGVFPLAHPYDAIGSGDDVAKGALYALSYNKYLPPKECIKLALNAAVEFTPFVRQPYVFESCAYVESLPKQAFIELSKKVS